MDMIGEMLEMFALHVRATRLPEPERAYVLSLCAGRSTGEVRFDFAWHDHRIAVRIGKDQPRIYEQAVRYVAEEQGWRVCFFTGGMVRCGAAIATFADEMASRDRLLPGT
ncbi:hypothetical protein R75461_08067 [Paraburkholderia nemoris]|uniref:hypothetical protein n=1 Tax=Paraburkholderia nemoris TaxID=2793076 RepID=UPI00190A9355|nr:MULTISPECIES: hypothetical protein [Paraburkholderia]MBK3786853.1 hypothetical protein [Paraburkholderia aspalathi]CAE6862621.1 hypothetical protein R75461_08067 [Paraburkholderia nemoris]